MRTLHPSSSRVTTPGIDFFRLDRGRPTRRLLAVASILTGVGGSVVGAHLVHRLDVTHAAWLSLAGGLTLMSGLLVGFGTLVKLLLENIWLAIRQDGVVLHDNGEETVLAWDDLARIDVEPGGHLVLARASAEPVRWYVGRSAQDIAARITEARRKAVHGLPIRFADA
jgi:hypothetical protein